MRIQHNIAAMNSYRNYTNNNKKLSKNLEKLSSGYKINRAGDDAAGLAISEKMRAQISGIEMASKNAKDGISVVQTAEGALTEVHDMLNRMFTLAEQACNGIYQASEKEKLQAEITQLTTEIDRIGDSTNFNGMKLLDGTLSAAAKPSTTVTGSLTTPVATATPPVAPVVVQGDSFKWSTEATEQIKKAFNSDVSSNGTGAVTIKVSSYTAATPASGSVAAVPASATLDIDLSALGSYTVKSGTYANSALNDSDVGANSLSMKLNDTQVSGGVVELVLQDGDKHEVGTLTFTIGGITGKDDTGGAAINLKDNSTSGSTTNAALTLQIGDSTNSYDQMNVSIDSMKAQALGIDSLNIIKNPGDAMGKIKAAIETVSVQRGSLGAYQNRLEHTINNLSVMRENIQDAEATIRDTDMAEEMMAYTKNNILNQSAQAMLAQANQLPQGVLQLLQ